MSKKSSASSVIATVLITIIVLQSLVPLTLADRDDVDAGEYDDMWLAKRLLNNARNELRKQNGEHGYKRGPLCPSGNPKCMFKTKG